MRVQLDGGGIIDLGTTETTPTISIIDYSRRVTDDFGVTTVVQRGFARRMSVRFALPFETAPGVQQALAELRATPARWIADDRFAWLDVFGFYKDFSLDHAVPPVSYCTLTVEGLAETEVVTDAGGDPAPHGQQSTLNLIQPAAVTGAALAATNMPENDHLEWSAVAIYGAGARAIKAATHRIYESVAAGNTGNDPAGAGAAQWLDVGPTNRWAMFDQALGTATTAAGSIVVTIDAGTVDSVALLDVTAATVRVQAPGYDRTIAVGAGAVTFLDMPLTDDPVTVTIAGSGNVSVGTLLIGRLVALGLTEASPTAEISDFSRKEVDDFGEVTIVQRSWAKRMSARALIRTDALDLVANRIAAVRARPSLWIGDSGLDSLIVYGFFKDFSIEVGETVSKLSLSIEGLSTAAPIAPSIGTIDWPDVIDSDPINHPKPADGATVGAPPGTPVNDRPSQSVTEAIDINTISILEEALRQDNLLEVFDARTLIEGQAVGPVFLSFKNEQETANSASATNFNLLGAKSPDGTSWVLNMATVKAGPVTLAQKFDEVGIALSDFDASVSELREVLIEPGGATARAVLKLDVGGNVSGTVATNDGTLSTFGILANIFRIVDPGNGTPYQVFTVADGVVKAHALEVDTLKVNTAVVPVRAAASASTTSSGGYSTVLSATISLPVAGWVEGTAVARQGFSSGDQDWAWRMLINGTQVFALGGGRTQDGVPLQGSLLCLAGTVTVQVQFFAHGSVSTSDRTLLVKGFPNTA